MESEADAAASSRPQQHVGLDLFRYRDSHHDRIASIRGAAFVAPVSSTGQARSYGDFLPASHRGAKQDAVALDERQLSTHLEPNPSNQAEPSSSRRELREEQRRETARRVIVRRLLGDARGRTRGRGAVDGARGRRGLAARPGTAMVVVGDLRCLGALGGAGLLLEAQQIEPRLREGRVALRLCLLRKPCRAGRAGAPRHRRLG